MEQASGEHSRCDSRDMVVELFDRFYTPITAYLYSLLDDWESAYDLAQETFLRAHRSRHQLPGVENPSAWLYRIATNLAFNRLKRRRRFAWLPWRTSDGHLQPADPHEQFNQVDRLERAMERLRPKYRAPLLLFNYYGFSIAEVAEMLDLSEGAVRVRLHRARTMLREIYTGNEKEVTV